MSKREDLVREIALLEAEQICIRYTIDCKEEAAQHRSRDHHKVAGELHQEALGAKECAKRIRALKHKAQAEESPAPQASGSSEQIKDSANPAAADDQNAAGQEAKGGQSASNGNGLNEAPMPAPAAPVAARSASVLVPTKGMVDAVAQFRKQGGYLSHPSVRLWRGIVAGDREEDWERDYNEALCKAMLAAAPAPVVDEEAVRLAKFTIEWKHLSDREVELARAYLRAIRRKP